MLFRKFLLKAQSLKACLLLFCLLKEETVQMYLFLHLILVLILHLILYPMLHLILYPRSVPVQGLLSPARFKDFVSWTVQIFLDTDSELGTFKELFIFLCYLKPSF